MSHECQFECPFDIPRGASAKWQFKLYLAANMGPIGTFGMEGEDVGFGFIWESRTGSDVAIETLSKRMRRALCAVGILSRRANIYHLEQKVTYIREGDPRVVFTLREER